MRRGGIHPGSKKQKLAKEVLQLRYRSLSQATPHHQLNETVGANDVAVDDQLTQDSEIDCDNEPPIEANHDTLEPSTPEPTTSVDITSPEAAAPLKQTKIEAALIYS